jgi:hypothetical protein
MHLLQINLDTSTTYGVEDRASHCSADLYQSQLGAINRVR